MSGDIPARVSAVVVHARGDLRVEDVPLPAVTPADAILRVAYGGICGSDLHYWTHGAAGESILREPLILGHEVVGTVVSAAADGSGPQAGTRVAVHPATVGETGERFPVDRPNLSPGSVYLGSAAHLPHNRGVFSEYVVLPAGMLRPLPDGLSLRAAAIAEPAAVAWRAVARLGPVAGRRVAVIGAGPIGLLAIAVLRRARAAEIIASDLAAGALERARAMGATSTVPASHPAGMAGIDADLVIESSGSVAGLMSAVRATTRGGRIVLVGLLPSGEQAALLSLVVTRELELVGSFRFNDELDEVLAALVDGSLDADGVVTHVVPATDAIRAFGLARDPETSGKVLLDFGDR